MLKINVMYNHRWTHRRMQLAQNILAWLPQTL